MEDGVEISPETVIFKDCLFTGVIHPVIVVRRYLQTYIPTVTDSTIKNDQADKKIANVTKS